MKQIHLFSGSVGLNNKVKPHRLKFSRKEGVTALEDTKDVLIDITGEIVSRRGSAIVQPGAFHSMHKTVDGFYVIEDRNADSALHRAVVNSTGAISLIGIRSGLSKGEHCSYADYDGKTLYANGHENGFIAQNVSHPWPVNDWTGQGSSSSFVSTPVGKHIDIHSGRALVAVDDELFYSEHALVGLVNSTKNRVRFESEVIMVCSVQGGVYVSDTKATYFLAGVNPNEWQARKVLDYPSYAKNNDLVAPMTFGIEAYSLSALLATAEGPVIGLPDGSVISLINKNVILPSSYKSGSIIVVDETTILQSGV